MTRDQWHAKRRAVRELLSAMPYAEGNGAENDKRQLDAMLQGVSPAASAILCGVIREDWMREFSARRSKLVRLLKLKREAEATGSRHLAWHQRDLERFKARGYR